nr:MAG TPA: hypothetical protein [Caudoviricetes sp.]
MYTYKYHTILFLFIFENFPLIDCLIHCLFASLIDSLD